MVTRTTAQQKGELSDNATQIKGKEKERNCDAFERPSKKRAEEREVPCYPYVEKLGFRKGKTALAKLLGVMMTWEGRKIVSSMKSPKVVSVSGSRIRLMIN